MDQTKREVKNKTKLKVIFWIIGILIVAMFLILLTFKNVTNKKIEKVEMHSVEKICQLATLKCYYHDVAEYRSDADGLFNYGYKKYWIEYTGIVELGVDVNEVQVNKPDENGVIKIYIPNAKIIRTDVDETTIKDPITDTGLFTSITSKEKTDAYTKAQETMKKNAENDTSILSHARNNAKKLLEQYITNIGEQYAIEWIDEPISVNK